MMVYSMKTSLVLYVLSVLDGNIQSKACQKQFQFDTTDCSIQVEKFSNCFF